MLENAINSSVWKLPSVYGGQWLFVKEVWECSSPPTQRHTEIQRMHNLLGGGRNFINWKVP